MALLNVSRLTKRHGDTVVLKDISFGIKPFYKVAIAGETGSGKSTLLKIIAGLVKPDEGQVLFNDTRVPGPDEQLLPGHPKIAYLSQHFELRNNYRVEELLEMANKLTDSDAAMIFELCQVEHLLRRRTDELSGGEKQRIALAKLLITAPQLLLLDEPFSNLDNIHKATLKTVIEEIGLQLNITCLLVSHDPIDVLSWADEIIVMKDGQIVQRGSPKHLYFSPVNDYIAALFGKYNKLSKELWQQFRHHFPTQLAEEDIIRPVMFSLEKKGNGIEGKVSKVNFLGAYYEIEVLVKGELIIVQTNSENFSVGELVYLSIAK